MIARFIGGLGSGGSSALGPVYIAELAPAKWRGRMVGLFQINIVVGILLAYLSNYIITTRNLGPLQWRGGVGVTVVASIFFLIMLFRNPRISRRLGTTHQTDAGREVLEIDGSSNTQANVAEIVVA